MSTDDTESSTPPPGDRSGENPAGPVPRTGTASAAPGQPGRLDVRLKRAYDEPAAADGFRVLIDRLWPRGLRKEEAKIDEWARELAPSDELRRWYGHEPARFAEFRRRYRAELAERAGELDRLRRRAGREAVTIVFAARDAEHSNAAVLAELLQER